MEARSAMLVATLLAAGGLAGCLENPLTALSTDEEVSAFENKKLADAAAADWNEKAELIGVMAFEVTESEEAMILPDPEVGNGLAPAWWYVYCAVEVDHAEKDEARAGSADAAGGKDTMMMASEVRAFKVTAAGEVTSEEDALAMAQGFDHEMAEAIGEWKIDSSDALAAAKTDEAFRKVAEGFNASVVEGLASHEGVTAWAFAAMSADGFVVAAVDALTGDVISIETMDMDFEVPSFEWGAQDPAAWTAEPIFLEGEGQASNGDKPLEVPFHADDAMHGTMMVTVEGTMPVDGLHWAILDAEGEYVTGDHVSTWMGGHAYEVEIELEDAGDYVLVVEYMAGFGFPLPGGAPVAGGVAYTYVLDLMPGEMEHEDEDDDG